MKDKPRHKIFEGQPFMVVIFRLLVVLLLSMFSRLLLYWLNPQLFTGVTSSNLAAYAFTGLRFDLSAVLYVNLPFIILMLLPFKFRHNRGYRRITDFIFYLVNCIGLLPNFIDSVYFAFTMKRLTGDIFKYIGLGSDTANLMPQFLHDFWYVLLLYILFVTVMIFICRRIVVSHRYPVQNPTWYFAGQMFITIILTGLTVFGLRGGLQLKPISVLTAGNYAPIQHTPLVLNSAFSILRTLDQQGLEKKDFFETEAEMLQYFNANKQFTCTDSTGAVIPMRHKNVVIIILESFSKEHIGSLNPSIQNGRYKGYTPFLDSLIGQSFVAEGYANGKRSIEGIPAVLASLPTWMTEDFITSAYAGNNFNSIASLLKSEGYRSAFFHGGSNGTMGFDAFCRSAGFEQYYGRSEYGNDSDYDGKWGIWDEPFLQFTANKLNEMKQPFVASVFTLSSHHPYKVPDKYSNKFQKGKLPIQRAVEYADYALGRFFNTVCSMPWYNNTLFVITADHTSESALPFYQNRVGQYSVPIILFEPDGSLKGKSRFTMQQTDIMPTVLQYLGYQKPFVAFGNSIFDTTANHAALSYFNNSYQLIQNGWVLNWDGLLRPLLFHFETDSTLSADITNQSPGEAQRLKTIIESYIEQYNTRMIDNRLIIR